MTMFKIMPDRQLSQKQMDDALAWAQHKFCDGIEAEYSATCKLRQNDMPCPVITAAAVEKILADQAQSELLN